MDTVQPRGMLARHPFQIDSDRAYGPGIADNETGSPGSRNHHTRLGAEHDAVMSFELTYSF